MVSATTTGVRRAGDTHTPVPGEAVMTQMTISMSSLLALCVSGILTPPLARAEAQRCERQVLFSLSYGAGGNQIGAAPGWDHEAAMGPRHMAFVHRGGVTPINLPELAVNSQFVWKGEITAAATPQQVSVQYGDIVVQAQVRSLTFRVDRAIKGTAPESGSASFDLYQPYGRGPLWGSIGGPFVQGWYGIMFLSPEDGWFAPTDPVYAGVQASPVPAPALAMQDPMSIVEGELINTLRDEQHARVQSAVDLLVSLHDQVATALRFGPPERVLPLDRDGFLTALRALSEHPDPILAGTALAALLRMGDLSRLADAISYLEYYGPPPDESTEPSYQGTDNAKYVRGQILRAISLLDDDTAAPLPNPLLQDPDSWVRRNAADALRRICNVSSMPYFAAALDDQDLYVAQAAIYGLLSAYERLRLVDCSWEEYKQIREHLGTVPEWDSGMLPSVSEFEKDPEPYRSWWKNWWETKGKAAYEAATSPPASTSSQ